MKKLNKIMSGLMSVCLCVANVSATCISVSAEGSKNNWYNAYANVLREYISSGVTATAKFSLCYVDDDDVPELIVHSSGLGMHADTDVYLYTFYNGQTYDLGRMCDDGYSTFAYYEKTGVIETGWLNQGVGSTSLSKLSAGKMESITSYSTNQELIRDYGTYNLTDESITLYLVNLNQSTDTKLSDIINTEHTYYVDWYEAEKEYEISRYYTTLTFENNTVKIVNAPNVALPTYIYFEIGKMIENNIFKLLNGKIQSGNSVTQDNISGTLEIIDKNTIKINYEDVSKIFVSDEVTITTTTTQTTNTTQTTTSTTTTTTTTTIPPVTSLASGDINGDNLIDAVDATAVSIEYAHLATGGDSTLTDDQKKIADVNGDGLIDSVDSTYILRYYAKVSAGENITFAEFVENNK